MADAPGILFDSLLALMDRLRSPEGCPWDREQTHQSLKPCLIEEAYEVLDAIDRDSTESLVEELGDLLLQVVFHCQVASERGEFTAADVLRRLNGKLVHRHPHVFGDGHVADAQDALAQWERLKGEEAAAAGRQRSALEGVPPTLPALLRAQRLQVKAGRVGFDWADWRGARAKVSEELGEVDRAAASGEAGAIREELGDLLFALVNVARLLGVDAEDALRGASDKFTRRFTQIERDLRAEGRAPASASAEELDRAWEAVKAREAGRAGGTGSPR